MKSIFTSGKTTFCDRLMLGVLFIIFSASTYAQKKYVIEASNNIFTPHEVEITTGDTVEWINMEGYHNVNGKQSTFPSNPESFGNEPGTVWTYSKVFNTPGTYNYQCDIHTGEAMIGVIKVAPSDDNVLNIVVDFTGMNPHIGQTLWLSVVDKESGREIDREKEIITSEFTVSTLGMETERSYFVNFYADFNENGKYDAPPVDHAWQLEVDAITGDTTLNFTHNTSFTDIAWQNRLTVNFMDMTPHIGQSFGLAVIEKNTGKEVYRVKATADDAFTVYAYGIEHGMSYDINFYADFNENQRYDTPPVDHAWSLDLENTTGDTTLNFSHNSGMITDIGWQNQLTVNFTGMNPHAGQDLWLAVINKNTGKELHRLKTIASVDFTIHVYGIEHGESYNIDFYADHNRNESYDAPSTDHAWRLELDDVTGDTTVNFAHNTNFTDIMWKNRLTVNFTGMNPHLGQDLWLAVIDKDTGLKADSLEMQISAADFMIHLYGIEGGKSYNIDFYADHNQNGSYDAPPGDHAWRMELGNAKGDTTLNFAHNTNFTNIFNTTSVAENNFSRFRIYPNPASNKITIETGKNNSENFTLSLYDITGKIHSVNRFIANQKAEIDIQNIPSGIYFLELRTKEQRRMLKLIKE